jgi:membrane protease YdiL (CAAX protease family)
MTGAQPRPLASDDLTSALRGLVYSIATILIVWVVSRVRGLSWVSDFHLIWPPWQEITTWLIIWSGWIAVAEFFSNKLGLPRPTRWGSRSRAVLITRIVTLVIISPIGEELVFRGVLFQELVALNLGPTGSTVISAGLFALFHFQYGWKQNVLIFVDGVVYAISFYHSDSLLLPILMHSAGNLYAVFQRVPRGFHCSSNRGAITP